MNKVIKNGAIVENTWILVTDTAIGTIDQLPAGDLILPFNIWQDLGCKLNDRKVGVWLNSDQPPSLIKDQCASLPIIAINFPIFTDGRGYSYAHVLRAQYHYSGELRAIGDVLIDQLFFMKRCGFDSLSMRADQNTEKALEHLQSFSNPYQAAIDKPRPLFRQR